MRKIISTFGLATALVLGSASPALADDNGEMHRGVDGCFAWSWNGDGFFSTTFYYHNRCRKPHKISIRWSGTGHPPQIITVQGHAKGSTTNTYSSDVVSVEDLGRA